MMHFPLNLSPSHNYYSKILKTFDEKHKTHADKVGKYMCSRRYQETPVIILIIQMS